MSATLSVLAFLLAIVAAVRSTWSPCGISMLSTLTPVAEAGRGHRFRVTSAWFVLGSVAGGITLGSLMAATSVAVRGFGISPAFAAWAICLAALATAASDGRIGAWRLPGHQRQVNERWLDRYRSWVYGGAFGWQIGVGLATYIMTSGLYLLILMGVLAGTATALWVGALFGLVRGLAVFLTAHLDSVEKLLSFHVRFESHRESIRQVTIAVQAVIGLAAAAHANPPAAILGMVVVAATALVVLSWKGTREAVNLNAALVGTR